MNPIARHIHYGLSEKAYKRYLEFIGQWWQLGEAVCIDPLAINTPPDKIELAYIERPEVEAQIYGEGGKIIVGTLGSGKTTLWQKQRSAKDASGRDMVFLRISPDMLTSACLPHHLLDRRVKILVDSTEHLNEDSLVYVVHTIQQWHAQASGLLDFVVFVDRERKDWVNGLDCVENRDVVVWELPPWQEGELQTLLGQRLAAWKPGAIDYASLISDIPGIPPDLFVGLQKVLQNFSAFKSAGELSAVFSDNRIVLWRNALPDASDPEARIRKTIAYLWECENDQNENGLILLLHVLSDFIHSRDMRKRQLLTLIKNLELVWQSSRLPTASLSSSDYALNWAMDIPGLADNEARRKFIPIILAGALRAKPKRGGLDTPIHALNLARGFIAACAGCWTKWYSPPLSVPQLQSIVAIYWGEGGEV